MNSCDIKKQNVDFLISQTKQILYWALEEFGEKIFMTSAFGFNGIVLLDLVRDIIPDMPVYFIDTGYHFRETLELKEYYSQLGCNIIDMSSAVDNKEAHLETLGHDLCCQINKVEPMRGLLTGREGFLWITALSRDQSESRRNISLLQIVSGGVLKVNPLFAWTMDDVWYYIGENRLVYNELHDKGYKSIGCKPCTSIVLSGEEIRVGRWRDCNKEECGLHTKL
jgi:phosphoadenosine phosphosulfate reductase